MRIDLLSLRGFRNYSEAEVRFDGAVNVITGRNAQGKTNLLEAAYLLSGGRSFRTRLDRELIGFSEEFAAVNADVFSGGRSQRIEILLRRGAKKSVSINRVRSAASELGAVINMVLFCPDDLNLLRDGPAARRRLLDLAICQLRPGYARLLSDYNRFYENKMRILRDYREDPSMLDTLDEFSDGLARASARIIRYRASFAQRLAAAAAPIHLDFSGIGGNYFSPCRNNIQVNARSRAYIHTERILADVARRPVLYKGNRHLFSRIRIGDRRLLKFCHIDNQTNDASIHRPDPDTGDIGSLNILDQ